MRYASRVSHDRDTVRALVRRRKMNEEQRAADTSALILNERWLVISGLSARHFPA
jgi:hypothetical protein